MGTVTEMKATKPAVRPVGTRVLFKPELNVERKTAGGIHIPTVTSQEQQAHGGIVVAAGDRVEVKVKVGDRILVTAYSGTRVKVDGEPMFLVNETEILAVIERGNVELAE